MNAQVERVNRTLQETCVNYHEDQSCFTSNPSAKACPPSREQAICNRGVVDPYIGLTLVVRIGYHIVL